jgi:hypothetical protein
MSEWAKMNFHSYGPHSFVHYVVPRKINSIYKFWQNGVSLQIGMWQDIPSTVNTNRNLVMNTAIANHEVLLSLSIVLFNTKFW